MLLETEKYYHIYNRSVGRDLLFISDENYVFFLKKFEQYISPIHSVLAYCLLPNHFHLVLRPHKEESIIEQLPDNYKRSFYENLKSVTFIDQNKYIEHFIGLYISRQFANLFSSYTQAFNKQQNRHGNLFTHTFKRKEIKTEDYLRKVILYIHQNPIHHKHTNCIDEWKHNSYNAIISDKPTKLEQKEVIKLFQDKENFIYCHKK